MVVQAARDADRTPSKLKLLFSAARFPRALATLTNEMPMRACTEVVLPKLMNTELGDTCWPGTLMMLDEVIAWSNMMSKNTVYRSTEPQNAPLLAEPDTSVVLLTVALAALTPVWLSSSLISRLAWLPDG